MPASFGKYELHRRLAIGGMAEIFLAHVKGIEGFSKAVVLKLILPHLAVEKEFVSMFIDEAKLASSLTHPNIVQVYELGNVEHRYFIAMEYVPGVDLATLTKHVWSTGERISPGAVLRVTLDALRGLHYAHEKKDAAGKSLALVHRDVSPQNILLSNDGTVKITDFGIAKAEGKSTRTRSGVLKGKFSYMAPEQAFGRVIDRRVDLFAMALVAYELLASKRAYRADNDLEMLDLARQAKLPPLTVLVPGFPEPLSQVFEKALAPNPDDRYATCSEFAQALAREGPLLAAPYDHDQLAQLVLQYGPRAVEAQPPEVLQLKSIDLTPSGDALDGEPLPDEAHADDLLAGGNIASPVAQTRPAAVGWSRWSLIAGGVALVAGVVTAATQLTKLVSVAEREPVAVVPTPASEHTDEPASVPATTAVDASAEATVDPRDAKVETKAAPASGFLMLNSRPWAYIYIDGKKLPTTTPLQKYRLSAGAHRVRLESPGAGRSDEFTVFIKAGGTEKKIVDFDQK